MASQPEMQLTLEQVRHVGELARLELTPQEEELYLAQLSHILKHIEQLQSLDLTGVPAMTHASEGAGGDDAGGDAEQGLRADAVEPSLGGERATANAPERVDTRIAVPRIID